MEILNRAINTMKDEHLWQYYLHDFISVKYTTYSDNDSESNELRLSIVSAYFDFHKHCDDDPLSKLAWVYIRSEFNKLNFAQAINRLAKLEPFVTRCSPSVVEKTLTTNEWKDLSSYVIESSYNSLSSIFNNWKEGDDNLTHWYKAYKDIVSNNIYIYIIYSNNPSVLDSNLITI